MSLDQLDDQLVKLKREQFNLRFQGARDSLRTRPGFARCAAISPV